MGNKDTSEVISNATHIIPEQNEVSHPIKSILDKENGAPTKNVTSSMEISHDKKVKNKEDKDNEYPPKSMDNLDGTSKMNKNISKHKPRQNVPGTYIEEDIERSERRGFIAKRENRPRKFQCVCHVPWRGVVCEGKDTLFDAADKKLSGVPCCNSPARCHHNSIYIWEHKKPAYPGCM